MFVNNLRRNIFLFSLLVFLLLFSTQSIAKETKTEAEKPGLKIQTLEGEQVLFKDQLKNGKWNIVFVWTTYCNHCVDQYSFLSELHADLLNDIEVLGICLDEESSIDKVKTMVEEKQHEFPSVMATATDFSNAYEINTGEPFSGTPSYLLYYGTDFQAFLDGPTNKRTIIDFIN